MDEGVKWGDVGLFIEVMYMIIVKDSGNIDLLMK